MIRRTFILGLGLALAMPVVRAHGQTFTTADPVLQQIWHEGMENSQTYPLAQALLDSIGPRLTGSPQYAAGADWLRAMYQSWGIEARNEQYGTWRGWRRGISHVDLVAPRVRSLEAMLLAWSPGSGGKKRGEVIVLPEIADSAAFVAWLPSVRDKFVMLSYPEPTCRPDASWESDATEATREAALTARNDARRAWGERLRNAGLSNRDAMAAIERAGARGIVTSNWSGGWGAVRIFSASTERIPVFSIGCEDYGLVARLAENHQGPVLEVEADAQFTGEVPSFNVIAEIPGTEKPDEYVVLSAHFDSWDGASGATDNGTGTLTILEAMRLLEAAYPHPKRTIIAGHWNSEEQGLNGSGAFATDHPEVVDGLQALFNQDNGTGRIVGASMQGLMHAGEFFSRWLSQIPQEIGGQVELTMPGMPGGGGSDYASFLCAGAPAFFLFAQSYDYFTYTWHTNRDTFDKLVFDDLKNNATLFAMLAYLASEDPERMPRDQRVLPMNQRTGAQRTWPTCSDGAREWQER